MERLRIEYGTGYMELNVEAFFPCKMPAARKAERVMFFLFFYDSMGVFLSVVMVFS